MGKFFLTKNCPKYFYLNHHVLLSINKECFDFEKYGNYKIKITITLVLNFKKITGLQNHKESKITIFEKENFIGRQWDICDDYPSLQAMGWFNKEVGSMKIQCGA